jgi:type IV pilus assembly protein PilV
LSFSRFPAPSRGFSLVEVLVALLILGCVVLGFVSLALQTSQQVHAAALRAQAHGLARDLVERINSNPVAWPAGFVSPVASDALCLARTPCIDPSVMAAQDLREIRELASQNLPQGRIAVFPSCHAESPTPCVVVGWQDVEAAPSACRATFVADTDEQPRCLIMHFWPAGAP